MCIKCADSGWVCENHSGKSWETGDGNDCECGGAGSPCECNPFHRRTKAYEKIGTDEKTPK